MKDREHRQFSDNSLDWRTFVLSKACNSDCESRIPNNGTEWWLWRALIKDPVDLCLPWEETRTLHKPLKPLLLKCIKLQSLQRRKGKLKYTHLASYFTKALQRNISFDRFDFSLIINVNILLIEITQRPWAEVSVWPINSTMGRIK